MAWIIKKKRAGLKKVWDKFFKLFLYGLLPITALVLLVWLNLGRVREKVVVLPSVIRKSLFSKYEDKKSGLTWLSTEGRYIVSENGERVVLRGVNLGAVNWGFDEWLPTAISYLVSDWKVNVVRVRVFQSDFHLGEEGFIDKLEREILRPARKAGIYIILNPWFKDKAVFPDEEGVRMWKSLAMKYKDDPHILYDLLAEPHDVEVGQIRQEYIELIPVIREVNPKSLIFVTGEKWGRYINNYATVPLPFENIVYRSNVYNETGDFDALFGDVEEIYPVFIGEFGADGFPAMSREAVSALLTRANENGIGWTAWHFHSQGCPCLLSNYRTFSLSEYGRIVYDELTRDLDGPRSKLKAE